MVLFQKSAGTEYRSTFSCRYRYRVLRYFLSTDYRVSSTVRKSSKCNFGQMIIRANIFSSKCIFDQMYFRSNVIRSNVFSSKCNFGQMIIQSKCIFYQMYFRSNAFSMKCIFDQKYIRSNVISVK